MCVCVCVCMCVCVCVCVFSSKELILPVCITRVSYKVTFSVACNRYEIKVFILADRLSYQH